MKAREIRRIRRWASELVRIYLYQDLPLALEADRLKTACDSLIAYRARGPAALEARATGEVP